MFAITPETYREFRDYIDSQPISAFQPKPGDDRPRRRRKPVARAQPSDAGADRKRNRTIFSHQKVAKIKQARTSWKETSASSAN
jgi:hypothetical protein